MAAMLYQLALSDPLAFALIAVIIVLSLAIHEFAHAWMADRLGDPTPRVQGRVTLNPLAHLDPLGTLMLLFIGFGWGKPVQFDPYNLKNPIKDIALIAFAGPLSNILIALLFAVAFQFGALTFLGPLGTVLAAYVVSLNVMLAVFNLVPVFPLDGEKVLTAFLPKRTALEFHSFMERYGMFVLLFLIIPWTGVSPISRLISPIIQFVTQALLG